MNYKLEGYNSKKGYRLGKFTVMGHKSGSSSHYCHWTSDELKITDQNCNTNVKVNQLSM